MGVQCPVHGLRDSSWRRPLIERELDPGRHWAKERMRVVRTHHHPPTWRSDSAVVITRVQRIGSLHCAFGEGGHRFFFLAYVPGISLSNSRDLLHRSLCRSPHPALYVADFLLSKVFQPSFIPSYHSPCFPACPNLFCLAARFIIFILNFYGV